jgi:hypothetical protein
MGIIEPDIEPDVKPLFLVQVVRSSENVFRSLNIIIQFRSLNITIFSMGRGC